MTTIEPALALWAAARDDGHTALDAPLWRTYLTPTMPRDIGTSARRLLASHAWVRLPDGALTTAAAAARAWHLAEMLAERYLRFSLPGSEIGHQEFPVIFSQDQSIAWQSLQERFLSILVGGPGTGKSFLIGRLAHSLKGVRVVTPTAKAAEVTRRYVGGACEVSTIHSLLNWVPGELPACGEVDKSIRVLIVDEMSMVDEHVFYELMLRVPLSTRVILVGDPDQLPPVSAGAPLADLVRMGWATRLTTVHRAALATGLPALAADMRVGVCDLSRHQKVEVVHAPPIRSEFFAGLVAQIPLSWLPGDNLVLYPVRDEAKFRNTVGSLNAALAHAHRGPIPSYLRAVEGNRVIGNRNDYSVGCVNGQLGTVLSASRAGYTIRWDNGRTSQLRGREDFNRPRFELGYGMTIHRAQGSEARVVVLVLDPGCASAYAREGLYVAATRARERLVCYGSPAVLTRAVGRTTARRTALWSYLTAPGTPAPAGVAMGAPAGEEDYG